MAKQSRQVFHSLRTKQGWKVEKDRQVVSSHQTQEEAERSAVKAGRKAHDGGGLGQAVLHKIDGSIREERTYGKDPERTPG